MSDPGTVHFSQESQSHNDINKITLGDGALKVLLQNVTSPAPFSPDVVISEPICQAILYDDIGQSKYVVYCMFKITCICL